MELLICINNYWNERTYYTITVSEQDPYHNNCSLDIIPKFKCSTIATCNRILKRKQISINGIQFFYLLKELLQFKEYRRILYTHLVLNKIHLLWLQIVPPNKDIIDWKWNHMLARKLWEKIETDYLMSWLSTLGGGYSALGEQFSKCAEVAGKISKKQLLIGIQLGDPFLQSRCLLYYSISLIQVGRLRTAKYIIRKQYAFARANEEVDGRLVKMCEGIWMRLQYEYGLRLKKKKLI
ncbi:uncharacterized protein F58A4.6 [Haematobia irritans]|uniref:uncharacterized protein F58A4.6 n=1 Tax=Haematobia irritans TaxID=7368 RepID=UPI003F4F872C